MKGILGKKIGMAQMVDEQGLMNPVTLVEISPNTILQVKTQEKDGKNALVLATGSRNKAKKNPYQSFSFIREISFASVEGMAVKAQLGLELFQVGEKVNVTGVSKGKGFQGGVKRWNFRTQDATHGNSVSHRVHGSTGQNQSPGRVFKGKKMAGHLGDERVTVQGLEVISVDVERSVLLIKGAVPGATGYDVIVRPSVKA